MFLGSFALLVGLGTLGLVSVPAFYVDGEPLGWQDALFTSTSAVCVTGLVLVDTATHFTFLGQLFLLLLIQLGGLGMLSLTSLIIVALGKKLSVRSESLSVGVGAPVPEVDVRKLVKDVARFTFTLEAAGAIALWLIWGPKLGYQEAIWPAIFHSVSAFCNAGFSIFSDSLISWQSSPATLAVISGLVVIGGLGFLTMEECFLKMFDRKWSTSHRLSLHSRLVVWTTLLLLLGGGLLFIVLEWRGVLSHLTWPDRIANGLFMSVTARTAGFNSVPYIEACDSSNFATILLMMIGGSPGSTAGGLKTTTFILLGLLAWSKLRGEETTVFANRSVPEETLERAMGLMVVSVGIVVIGTLLLLLSESLNPIPNGFLRHSFEVVSAVNTVGLSLDVTNQLNVFSRGLITLLMFFGRVGPLTVVAAFAISRKFKGRYRLAYEDVTVG